MYPDYKIILILDNVSYHKSEKTKQLLQRENIILKFQPPYSPDLNPIEPSWDTTKNEVRNNQSREMSFIDKLSQALVTRTWSGY